MRLGCIADDFTGGTDLAGVLSAAGVPTVQVIGVPDDSTAALLRTEEAEAVVVALKTRTAPVADAVAESVAALRRLRELGCERFYFKYCSTFDSTPAGNIGPVIDALLDELGADLTVVVPSLPANGRTVYMGHLFVNGVLLNESSMRHHPLTPMDDANLVRVLGRQTPSPVGKVDRSVVGRGPEAIGSELDALRMAGVRMAVVDAIDDDDLRAIGRACAGFPLVTGGSGLGIGLGTQARRTGAPAAGPLAAPSGLRAVISGSCSAATNAQVAEMRREHPAFAVDPFAVARDEPVARAAVEWARPRLRNGPVLVYATEHGEQVARDRGALPPDISARIEGVLAEVARGVVEAGVTQLVIGGGETSGAVVQALGVTALRIGSEIVPGVPWTVSLGREEPVALALKSGNFGGPRFFLDAWKDLP